MVFITQDIQGFKRPAWKLYLFSCVKLLSLLVAPVWSLVLDWRFVRSPRPEQCSKVDPIKKPGFSHPSLCHWNHKLCLPTPSKDTWQNLWTTWSWFCFYYFRNILYCLNVGMPYLFIYLAFFAFFSCFNHPNKVNLWNRKPLCIHMVWR